MSTPHRRTLEAIENAIYDKMKAAKVDMDTVQIKTVEFSGNFANRARIRNKPVSLYGFHIYCYDPTYTETIKGLFSELQSKPKIMTLKSEDSHSCIAHALPNHAQVAGYAAHSMEDLIRALKSAEIVPNSFGVGKRGPLRAM